MYVGDYNSFGIWFPNESQALLGPVRGTRTTVPDMVDTNFVSLQVLCSQCLMLLLGTVALYRLLFGVVKGELGDHAAPVFKSCAPRR